MILLNVEVGQKTKSYLKNFSSYHFTNGAAFIRELFVKNDLPPDQTDNLIYSVIKEMGYNRLSEIPKSILIELEKEYYKLISQEIADLDSEKIAYLFLHAWQQKRFTLLIDNNIIREIELPITLGPQSVISIIDSRKIQDITFNFI